MVSQVRRSVRDKIPGFRILQRPARYLSELCLEAKRREITSAAPRSRYLHCCASGSMFLQALRIGLSCPVLKCSRILTGGPAVDIERENFRF